MVDFKVIEHRVPIFDPIDSWVSTPSRSSFIIRCKRVDEVFLEDLQKAKWCDGRIVIDTPSLEKTHSIPVPCPMCGMKYVVYLEPTGRALPYRIIS